MKMTTNEPIFKENDLIDNRFKVVKQIGRYYKEVFVCLDIEEDNKELVIKAEQIGAIKESRLKTESHLYERLKLSESFSFVLKSFNDTNFRYILMKRLGPNLQNYFETKRNANQWDLEIVIFFADQMISRVANSHLRNIVHRDIKPENFVLDLNDDNILYLIDFNLGKEICDKNGIHIPFKKRDAKYSVGNVQFLSLNAHNGEEQSRRDDLLSLGYSLIYLAKGSLPWTKMVSKNFKSRFEYLEAVREEKRNCSIEKLCHGLPKEFCDYMTYCTGLKFEEKPNYIELRTHFTKLLKKLRNNKSKPLIDNEWQNSNDNTPQTNNKLKLSQVMKRIGQTSPNMICP